MRRSITILLAGALVCSFSACGGSKHDAAATNARPGAVATAALTGLPDPSGAAAKRCSVMVKIDNTEVAQPHYALEQADVIYEEVVEGGITRLAAVFNSQAPNRVGPVRSVRRTDASLVWPLGGVFAYSGGAAYAIASINAAPVVLVDETRAGSAMFRDHSRAAPHNLYTRVDKLFAKCGTPVPPPALFSYRSAGATVVGDPVASVRVGFKGNPSYAVTWVWDAKSALWRRDIFGEVEVAASGARLGAQNVVVMFARYAGGVGVEGSEAQLTGTGKLLVFTAGREITGTWSRLSKETPARLLDAAGQPIRLTPGHTWVELPDVSYAVTVKPGIDSTP